MEDRELVRGMFSTSNGKYAFREMRHRVRPIFREDDCFRNDVEEMAQRTRQDFPQECKLMTAADACHVEKYFDAVDIQMQSHVFLYEVLMRVVIYNFEEARERVQEYADRVLLDPVRYERLTFDDSEDRVFSEEEQDLVGYDNTLPAALIILKQRKYPQAFNGITGFYSPGLQGALGTHDGLSPTNNVGTNAFNFLRSQSSQALKRYQNHPHPPRGSSQAEQCRKQPEHIHLQAARPSLSRPVMYPNSAAGDTDSGPMGLHDQMTPGAISSSRPSELQPMLLKQTGAESVIRWQSGSRIANWQEHLGDSTPGSNDCFRESVDLTTNSLIHARQGFKESRHIRGIQKSAKKISDDVRRQGVVVNVRTSIPHPYETQSVPTTTLHTQRPLIQRQRNCAPVIDQMNPLVFGNSLIPSLEKRASMDFRLRKNSSIPVPYYPRPEDPRTRAEIGEVYRQYAKDLGNANQPRILSNPFPPTILEDSEGERHTVDQTVGLFPLGHQRTAVTSSRLSRSSMHHEESHDSIPHHPQSNAFLNKENVPFGSQSSGRQSVGRISPQNQQGNRRNPDHDQLWDHLHHRQSFHQEQQHRRCLAQPSDDCILFVSGLPEHLDAKAIWHMLSPVQGLKWIAPLKKAQNEEGQLFTNLVFQEPSFAAEAQKLLPRTLFTAMSGRFLKVRPFLRNRAGPILYWNPSTSTRTEKSVHRPRRSSEPTFPAHSQIASFNHVPGHKGPFLASSNSTYLDAGDIVAQEPSTANNFMFASGYPYTPEADKASYRRLQGDSGQVIQVNSHAGMSSVSATAQTCESPLSEVSTGSLKMMTGHTTASTGSPVKRAKWKGSNAPKTGNSNTTDHMETPLKQMARDKASMLEFEVQDLATKATEVAAIDSQQVEKSFEYGVEKPVVGLDQSSSNEPGFPARQEQKVQPKVAEMTDRPWDDTFHHPQEQIGPSIIECTVQTPQTNLHLEEDSNDHKRSVHLRLSPTASGNSASCFEAMSPEETQLTAFATEMEILQRDLPKNGNLVGQLSTAVQRRGIYVNTNEQQIAAETSQRRFAARLVQTQFKANDSKQRVKGRQSSTGSRAMEQHPHVKVGAAKKVGDTSKRRSNETMMPGRSPDQVSQNLLSHPTSAPTTVAQRLPSAKYDPAANAQQSPSSVGTDEESLLRSMTGSVLAETASVRSHAATSPTTVTITHTEHSNHNKRDNASLMIGIDLQADRYNGMSAEGKADAVNLQAKLESVDVQCGYISQPVRAAADQQSSRFPLSHSDPPHSSPPTKEIQAVKENISITPHDQCEKLPSLKKQEQEDFGLDQTMPARDLGIMTGDISQERLDLNSDEGQNEGEERPAVPAQWLTGDRSPPESPALNDRNGLTISEGSGRSPDQPAQSPAPVRSGITPHSPSLAPILTRKKKQKKVPQTIEASRATDSPWRTRSYGGQECVGEKSVAVACGGGKLKEEFDPITKGSTSSSDPPLSTKDSVQITDTVETTPKTEVQDIEAPRSTSTRSLLFVTPPTTHRPKESSLVGHPPIASFALVDRVSMLPRDCPSGKSKNRKKNRPGKKKPKAASKTSVVRNISVTAPIITDIGKIDAGLSNESQIINNSSNKYLLDGEVLRGMEDTPTREAKHGDCQNDDVEGTNPPLEFSLKDDQANEKCDEGVGQSAPHDVDIDSEQWKTSLAKQGSWTSDRHKPAILEIARDAGYAANARSVPTNTSGKPGLAPVGCGFNKSTLVMELRSRCSRAAMQRIQNCCELEEQKEDSLYPKMLSYSTRTTTIQNRLAYNVTTVDPYKVSSQHPRLSQEILCEDSSGIGRVLALDAELQLAVREAVQMGFPLPSDRDDMESGKLYTLDSRRAKRVIEIAGFREISPLTFGQSQDAEWISEWCNEVSQWLYGSIPRITEFQKKAMYQWERANSSKHQNLIALGFTAREINECGLIWTPRDENISALSAQDGQEPNDLRLRRASMYGEPSVSSPCQTLWDAGADSNPEDGRANAALDPEVEQCQVPFEGSEGFTYGAQRVIDVECGNEEKASEDFDEAHPMQVDTRGEGTLTVTQSSLLKTGESKDEERQKVEIGRKAKPLKFARSYDERTTGPISEGEKASVQKQLPGLSFSSVDRIIGISPAGLVSWKAISEQLSIAAAIKQNEVDLQGKSMARKYKRVDQTELKTLGLASPLSTTDSSTSTVKNAPTMPTTVAAQSTPESSQTQLSSTANDTVSSSKTDYSLSQTSSTAPSGLQVLRASKPSYASALQSPISRSRNLAGGLRSSYATALQVSGPIDSEPKETDAWALLEEEAWGSANQTGGEGNLSPGKTGEGSGGGALRRRMPTRGRGSYGRGRVKD